MPPEPRVARVEDDRLSALPDGLLHDVLSFLPSPEAVRTCVLSRRWRDLWRTAPCVNIDMREYGISAWAGPGDDDLTQNWSRFADFTTNLLLLRSATVSLDAFRLYSSISGNCLREVDRWVRCGIKCCPQTLQVVLTGRRSSYCPFPPLFPPLPAASCRRLKSLRLCGVSLDRSFAERIQSECTVLEELKFWGCCHSFQEITSRTLRRLTVDATVFNVNPGRPLVITAPSLMYLQIRVGFGSFLEGISVHETASLLEAVVHLRYFMETFSLENQRSLLKDLHMVSKLELGGFETKAMLDEQLDKFPIFHNMQTLSLVDCFCDDCHLYDKLEALGSFLQNVPILKKLTLQSCMFDFKDKRQIVRKSIILPNQCRNTFQCQWLKFVEVIYKADHDNQLIELLWGIGRILPNATIKLTNDLVG